MQLLLLVVVHYYWLAEFGPTKTLGLRSKSVQGLLYATRQAHERKTNPTQLSIENLYRI